MFDIAVIRREIPVILMRQSAVVFLKSKRENEKRIRNLLKS
ncbi:hypothetical protein RV13_GL003033 [Enterococcus raffinosus]|nr:hypothetical protein RV13_GL003033 [Enterococcus raffinosus]